jgi:hypothetical protein
VRRIKYATEGFHTWTPDEVAQFEARHSIGDEIRQAVHAAGFAGWFRERCDEDGLPQCTAHGIRKAGATLAAENGATMHQLMAIFDCKTPGQAKVYTDAADRKRLAGRAMPLLDSDRSENTGCRTETSPTVAPK